MNFMKHERDVQMSSNESLKVYSLRFEAVAASPDEIKSQSNYCPFLN